MASLHRGRMAVTYAMFDRVLPSFASREAAIGDKEVVWLSRDIARKIEEKVTYPGQIRVSVIRETRTVDFAM